MSTMHLHSRLPTGDNAAHTLALMHDTAAHTLSHFCTHPPSHPGWWSNPNTHLESNVEDAVQDGVETCRLTGQAEITTCLY